MGFSVLGVAKAYLCVCVGGGGKEGGGGGADVRERGEARSGKPHIQLRCAGGGIAIPGEGDVGDVGETSGTGERLRCLLPER